MNIGKIRGALICAIIVGVYYKGILPWAHSKYFGFAPEYGFWTEVIFYGLILTQIVMTRPGERVQLTFMGEPVESVWGGFGLLPNILHITVFLGGSALFWGLVRLKSDKYTYEEHRDVHLNVSDSNTKYNVNSTLPYGAAQVSRAVGIVLEFLLVRWTRAPLEYKLSALGYSAYLVGVIMVCLNSSAIVAKQKLGGAVTTISQSVGIPVQTQQQPQTVHAPQGLTTLPKHPPPQVSSPINPKDRVPFSQGDTYYNLLEQGAPRVTPDPRWFSGDQPDFLGTTSDGVSYYSFSKNNEGRPLQSFNLGRRNSCLIVPKGSAGYINAAYPPKYVHNMRNEILVGMMTGEPTNRPRNALDVPGNFWMTDMNWKAFHDSWNDTRQQFGQVTPISNGAKVVPFFVKGPPIRATLSPDKPTGLICF